MSVARLSLFPRNRAQWIAAGVAFVLLLLVIRAALPIWIRDWANGHLDQMGPYHGHVQDVDLKLWKGAYTLQDLRITKRVGEVPVPFVQVPRMDIGIAWKDLLKGRFVAVASLWSPEVNFVDSKDGATQAGLGVNWRRELEALAPMALNEVTVHDGNIWFRNFTSSPPVDLQISQVYAVANDLSNRPGAQGRSASFALNGQVLEQAPLSTSGSFDPLAWYQDFRFRLQVKQVELPNLNEFLQAYARIDVEQGVGDYFMELDARDGRLFGYAKPLFRDIQVFSWEHDVEEQGDSPLRVVWEAIVSGLENLFKNQELDQLATRVDIEGEIGEPEASAMQAISGIIRNAFVEAYRPLFEDLPQRSP
jgi:hypothetical protein